MKIKETIKKFNIIDWLIIIAIIVAVCFAFVYINQDDTKTESTSIDETTLSKIGAKYADYYLEGDIVKTDLKGYNATTGERININGIVKWEDDDSGARPKLLIENNGTEYLAAFYNDEKNADIYIEQLTLEKDDAKYNKTADITINSEHINTLNELTQGIPNNTDYEITTTISIDPKDSQTYQILRNKLIENHYRISIKPSNTAIQDKIEIIRGTEKDLQIGNDILGNINGETSNIIIRIYNYDNSTIKTLEDNYNVTNIKYIT